MGVERSSASVEWEAIDASRLFLTEEMDVPRYFSFCGFRVAAFSGRCPEVERSNQDAAALIPFDKDSGVLVVADGVGGGPSGGTAARLAVEAVRDAMEQARTAGKRLREGVLDGFDRANHLVTELGTGSATTLLVVQLQDGVVRPYHVGDTEAAIVGQRGKLKLSTVSHTPTGYGQEAGLLSEREALRHEERHLVLNLVGTATMRIEVGSTVKLAKRDTLLLATDGLFDNWRLDQVIEQIRRAPLAGVAQDLVRATHRRMFADTDDRPSKPDDLTFLMLRR